MTGLKIVDTDGDTQITGDEFMAYVQGSERVNQKWLSRATEEQPCMLRNAQCDSHIRSHSSAMSAYMHARTCHIPCTVGMMTHTLSVLVLRRHHYNHTLVFGELGVRLRDVSTNKKVRDCWYQRRLLPWTDEEVLLTVWSPALWPAGDLGGDGGCLDSGELC